jgi:hypothetical protein
MKKKREYQSSELVKVLPKFMVLKISLALQVKDFLEDYLDQALFDEIESVNLKENILEIKIKSALLRNDFRMKKTFFLKKFQEEFGVEKFNDLYVL